MRQRWPQEPQTEHRLGFTLLELLIVISILVTLLSITAVTVRYATDADRIKGAAAKVQSVILGARDRAIYAKERRGVRLFLDPRHNPNATNSNSWGVSSMVYINPAITWSEGNIVLERPDLDFNGTIDNTFNMDGTGSFAFTDPEQRSLVWIIAGDDSCGWWELKRRGLLFDGLQIEIPKDSSNWYPVRTHLIDLSNSPKKFNARVGDGRNQKERLVLQVPYAEKGNISAVIPFPGQTLPYRLKLPPQILPEEPMTLPDFTIIDLDRSKVPQSWPANGGQFMDIVFSPEGKVVGDGASGLIHLYVSSSEDALVMNNALLTASPPMGRGLVPADVLSSAAVNSLQEDYIPGDRRIVTVSPQAGNVSVHEVDPADAGGDSFADDPYRFAVKGRTAKQ